MGKSRGPIAAKASAPAIVAAALLFAASAVAAGADPRDQVAALQQDSRTVALSDRLLVNIDAAVRYVFPSKCEAEGESELVALAYSSNLEESYVFVPALCLWIETGYGETRSTVLFDKAFFDEIVRQFDQLVVYHLHPGFHETIENYFPAFQDLITMTLIDAELVGRPAVHIEHRAVTPLSVIDYRLADTAGAMRLLKKYADLGLAGSAVQNLAYEYNRRGHVESYLRGVEACAERAALDPGGLDRCPQVRTDLFVLSIRRVRSPGQ
ncbi:hypothetical protein SAMN06265365_11056 [Tistlia consotensis]|uniref:Uncharacterized protein n=1 Tax=Tistlia consotensis USBA 355 TaxID=560819 RepID=A0A1Y6C0N9_9PROT|nr:hypothetical protein [Tistlia consotensis]SMF27636.1 hypothetical protein SAMN05428998_109100 [Tistlia consotensis USBA 355]SNR65885.1 hypothetical protein SAMN06265365_11056 [Tistlia consotensis]